MPFRVSTHDEKKIFLCEIFEDVQNHDNSSFLLEEEKRVMLM